MIATIPKNARWTTTNPSACHVTSKRSWNLSSKTRLGQQIQYLCTQPKNHNDTTDLFTSVQSAKLVGRPRIQIVTALRDVESCHSQALILILVKLIHSYLQEPSFEMRVWGRLLQLHDQLYKIRLRNPLEVYVADIPPFLKDLLQFSGDARTRLITTCCHAKE